MKDADEILHRVVDVPCSGHDLTFWWFFFFGGGGGGDRPCWIEILLREKEYVELSAAH